MPSHATTWLRTAAIGTVVLLGACAQMNPPPAPPPQPVVSNPPPVAPGPSAVWYHVSFNTNATTIDPAGRGTLAEVTAYLTQHPELSATIIGRTDSVGSRAYNMHLSHRRADVVRDALVYNGKISAERVETRWIGETQQVGRAAGGVASENGRVVDIAVH